jgi:hypothetical protein
MTHGPSRGPTRSASSPVPLTAPIQRPPGRARAGASPPAATSHGRPPACVRGPPARLPLSRGLIPQHTVANPPLQNMHVFRACTSTCCAAGRALRALRRRHAEIGSGQCSLQPASRLRASRLRSEGATRTHNMAGAAPPLVPPGTEGATSGCGSVRAAGDAGCGRRSLRGPRPGRGSGDDTMRPHPARQLGKPKPSSRASRPASSLTGTPRRTASCALVRFGSSGRHTRSGPN